MLKGKQYGTNLTVGRVNRPERTLWRWLHAELYRWHSDSVRPLRETQHSSGLSVQSWSVTFFAPSRNFLHLRKTFWKVLRKKRLHHLWKWEPREGHGHLCMLLPLHQCCPGPETRGEQREKTQYWPLTLNPKMTVLADGEKIGNEVWVNLLCISKMRCFGLLTNSTSLALKVLPCYSCYLSLQNFT